MDNKSFKKFAIWAIIIILLVPFLVNGSMFIKGSITSVSLEQKDWLQFWSGYFGGLLGGIATFVAVYITYKQNCDMHQQNINFQSDIKRMEIIPYLDVRIDNVKMTTCEDLPIELQNRFNSEPKVYQPNKSINSLNRDLLVFHQKINTDVIVFGRDGIEAYRGAIVGIPEYHEAVQANQAVERFKEVVIQNIGCNTAHTIKINVNGEKILLTFHLPKGGEFTFYIFFPCNVNKMQLDFSMYYSDLHNNEYVQTIQYSCEFVPVPSFTYSCSSAPTLINKP